MLICVNRSNTLNNLSKEFEMRLNTKICATRTSYYANLAARLAFIFTGPAIFLHAQLYLLIWFLGLYLMIDGRIKWPVYNPQSAHADHVQKPW